MPRLVVVPVSDATFDDVYLRLIESCPAVERMDLEREHVFYSAEHGPMLTLGTVTLARERRPDPEVYR